MIFNTKFVFGFVFLLALSIFLQPLNFVFANEESEVTEATAQESPSKDKVSESSSESPPDEPADKEEDKTADKEAKESEQAEQSENTTAAEADSDDIESDQGENDSEVTPENEESTQSEEVTSDAATEEGEQEGEETSGNSSGEQAATNTTEESGESEPFQVSEEETTPADSAADTEAESDKPSTALTTDSTGSGSEHSKSTTSQAIEEETEADGSSSSTTTASDDSGESAQTEKGTSTPNADPQVNGASTSASTTNNQATSSPSSEHEPEVSLEPTLEPAPEPAETAIPQEETITETVSAPENLENATNLNEEESVSATGTEATPAPIEMSVVVNDQNRYQFGTQECVHVGNGSYYCSKQTSVGNSVKDEVVARKDSEGDREIFITVNGEEEQITDNQVDDLSPQYDETSQSIVWQSLVNGRYQIMQFSFNDGRTVQLTDTDTNNTEPSIDGAYISWQHWDGEDWEIVLFDGSDLKYLTDNQTHDLAPSVHEGRVIWTTSAADGTQVAKVYDIESGKEIVIEDAEGGTVQNPRYVLVYEAKYDNGDIITKGFDPDSGAILSLAAEPVEVPDKLPESDSTGETRALLQQKAGKEDSAEDLLEPQSSDPEPDTKYDDNGTETLSLASTSENGTLDLQATSTSFIELDEYDVPVPPFVSSTSSQAGNSTSSENLVE